MVLLCKLQRDNILFHVYASPLTGFGFYILRLRALQIGTEGQQVMTTLSSWSGQDASAAMNFAHHVF